MIQEIHPTTDKRFNRRRFTCQSGTEAQDYRKTFIADDHQLTHAVRIKWIDELHFEVWPEPLTLVEIAIRSDGFTRLQTAELRWLAAEHKIDVAKLKPEKGQTDREAFIVALADIAKGPPAPAPTPTSPPKTTPAVIPPEVKVMDEATLETRAAELEVIGKYPKWGKMRRAEKEHALAQAIAERTK